MGAAEDMSAALVELTEHDQVPPCARNPEQWLSDDARQRATAAGCCACCPVLQVCGQFADEVHASFGVFGGRDRTRKQRGQHG